MSAFNSRAPRNTDDRPESYGFVTFQLSNGQQLEGYLVLSEKNLARLGISKEHADNVVGKSFTALATIRTKSEPAVAEPVELF